MWCPFLLTSMVLMRKPTLWYFVWASFQLSPNMLNSMSIHGPPSQVQKKMPAIPASGGDGNGIQAVRGLTHPSLPLVFCNVFRFTFFSKRAITHSLSSLRWVLYPAGLQSPWRNNSLNSFSPAVFSPPPTSPLMWSFLLWF